MARLLALLTTTVLLVGGLTGAASAAPALSIRPAASSGGAVTLSGRAPHAHGHTKVTIQRRVGHRWRTAGSARTNRSGAYRLTVHVPVRVTVVLRARVSIAGRVHISRALSLFLGASPTPIPSATPVPSPAPGAPDRIPPAGTLEGLGDVACPTDQLCWAVGRSDAEMPAVSQLSGTTWTTTVLSMPAGEPTGDLYAVACPTATFCTAVGSTSPITGKPLVATWSDGTWTTSVLPRPSGLSDTWLGQVSCPSAWNCVAIGDDIGNPATRTAVVATLTPAGWATSTPLPQPASVYYLSCPAVGECVAVDGRTIGTLHAGTWATQTLDPTDALADVTCPTVSTCWAVGSRSDGSALVVHLVDGVPSATSVAPPTPTTASEWGSTLTSVACVSDTSCSAAGSADYGTRGAASDRRPLVATLSDTGTWTSASPMAPGELTGSLSTMVCPTADTCTAIGTSRDASKVLHLQSAGLSATGWSAQSFGTPLTAVLLELPLACPSVSRCVIVGSDSDGTTFMTPYTGTETDGTWAFSNPATA